MARADSEIINAALAMCGVKRQVGSSGDGSAEANVGAILYPIARDGLLGEAWWGFATRRKTLTARTLNDEYVTRTNWLFSFALPDDYLYARYITVEGCRNPSPEQRIPFAIEAGDSGVGIVLLCDTEEPELVYTGKINDVGSYPPPFVEALTFRLAAMMVLPLAVNPNYAITLGQLAQQKLMLAIASSGKQRQEDPPPDSEIITARL